MAYTTTRTAAHLLQWPDSSSATIARIRRYDRELDSVIVVSHVGFSLYVQATLRHQRRAAANCEQAVACRQLSDDTRGIYLSDTTASCAATTSIQRRSALLLWLASINKEYNTYITLFFLSFMEFDVNKYRSLARRTA
jgi:hypothetical protein